MENRVTGSYDYNVICRMCGFKLKASAAKKRWDGVWPLCPDTCWEPRHPLDFYKERNDFHKLPLGTSPDPSTLDGFFPSNNYPDLDLDEDDFDSAFNVGVSGGSGSPAITAETVGQYFTCNATGYIEAVRIYYGVPEGQTANGDTYPAFNRDLATSVYIAIWEVSGTTVLWSTRAKLTPGKWNTVQVSPNIACTSGLQYCVGSSTKPSFIAAVTLPAQQYATSNGMYSHATAETFPTSAQASYTALADIKIRKTQADL